MCIVTRSSDHQAFDYAYRKYSNIDEVPENVPEGARGIVKKYLEGHYAIDTWNDLGSEGDIRRHWQFAIVNCNIANDENIVNLRNMKEM